MMTRKLLLVTALVETPVGVVFLSSPALVVPVLLGVSLDAPAAFVMARMFGAALLSLAAACWLARDDGPSRARYGLVAALAVYNGVAVAVLVNAVVGLRLAGVLTWPAVALHAGLTVWCLACLRSRR